MVISRLPGSTCGAGQVEAFVVLCLSIGRGQGLKVGSLRAGA